MESPGESLKLEERLITSSSLANGIGDGSGVQQSDSSATPAVVLSTLVAICGSLAYGCSVGYSSPVEAGIMADLGLSLREYSLFGSLMTMGAIIGSLVNGKIADVIGRKGAMWLSELFFIVGWPAIAFSKDVWSLCLGRFSIGIGTGLMAYVIPIYIAEITPKNIRGMFTAANQLLFASGISLMYLIGTVVSWQCLASIAAVPCLLQVVGLFFIPESPRWLAKIGQVKELETTLQRLRGKEADISEESADLRGYTDAFQRDSKAGIFDLFQRRYAYSLTVGVGLMLMQTLGGSTAIAYYASSVFDMAGFSNNIGTVSLAIVQVPVVGASVLLTDKFGRRPLLLASTIGMCSSLGIIVLALGLQEIHHQNEFTPVLVLIGIMGYTVTFSIGMAGLPNVIMSEIFPLNIKGSAGSLVTFLHNSSNWLVAYAFNFMIEWSMIGTFSIFCAICAAGVPFVAFLVPETKGRTLEEIQRSITNFSG